MQFKIQRASKRWTDESEERTFESLEDLKRWQLEIDEDIIVNFRHGRNSILIYDDYLESEGEV